jgi:multiple sugar transport system substrate-binding protein
VDGRSEEPGVQPGQQARAAGSGIGTPGEKAATAIADFIVVDMFANYCTGAKDAKARIAEAERQLKRIYR